MFAHLMNKPRTTLPRPVKARHFGPGYPLIRFLQRCRKQNYTRKLRRKPQSTHTKPGQARDQAQKNGWQDGNTLTLSKVCSRPWWRRGAWHCPDNQKSSLLVKKMGGDTVERPVVPEGEEGKLSTIRKNSSASHLSLHTRCSEELATDESPAFTWCYRTSRTSRESKELKGGGRKGPRSPFEW